MAKLPDSGTKVVLVVNDDPVVRGRVVKILAEAGYVVLTASDEGEALLLAQKRGAWIGLVVVGSGAS